MTGIICINKQKDITSFGVVAKVRGITREKKAGHTGTLDPMATGVLPVMLGGATRFLDFLPNSDKGYRATFVLGKTTDTLDITGKVTGEYTVDVTSDDIKNLISEFVGEISQIPPMYSAVRVDGKRLYELARNDIEVQRAKRKATIYKLDLISCDDESHTYIIDVICSKGTYIRTLIDDIGKKLGCGAVMTELVRTSAMGLTLDKCVTLDKLQQMRDEDMPFSSVLIPIEEILQPYEKVDVTDAQARRFLNGGALDIERLQTEICDGSYYRVYSPEGEFLGLGKGEEESVSLKIARLLIRK